MKKSTGTGFILDFRNNDYPYWQEINEGIVKQVKPTLNKAAILDVGAGRGALGEALAKRGYDIYAIECNQTAADEAATRLNHVICENFEDSDKIHAALMNKKFRYIIFSDVLEHVFDPMKVVRDYLPFLEDDGRLLISLPNALNWFNRLQFMFGRFNYEMSGVMDRTHMRFFTFKSARKMIEASQCSIETVDSTPFLVRAFLPIIKNLFKRSNDINDVSSIANSPFYKFYQKFLYPVEYWISRIRPSLFSFRMIFVAKKLM